VAQHVLEFFKLCCRRIFPCKPEEALQVVDDGIQRTVLVIGGTAKLNSDSTVLGNLVLEFLDKAGFANTSFATEQDDLAFAIDGLFPAAAQ
jgi:hypothetical protein